MRRCLSIAVPAIVSTIAGCNTSSDGNVFDPSGPTFGTSTGGDDESTSGESTDEGGLDSTTGFPGECQPGEEGACYSGDDQTVGMGMCAMGVHTCDETGHWRPCEGEVLPEDEACNGFDDNCDGAIDETCDCAPDDTQDCYSRDVATLDVGECVSGTQTCQDGGSWGPCEGDVTPSDETCNGLDDDCDAAADEDIAGAGRACSTGGLGVCAEGVQTCTSGVFSCVQTGVSGIEACDGVDNDCDGSSDEDNPGGGGTCNTGLAGVCGQGVQNCSGGSVQCTATASATTETCDANDNDCDGNTDEGNPGGGGSCNTGLQGACAAGIFTCQAGNIMCLQSSPGGAEVCDAVDNDCDGSVDEGFAVDASNGNVDFPNAWAVTIPQLASYPGTGAGIINGRLLPEGDNDWFTIHAVEDEDDIFGDTAVKGSMTITSPGNGLWYEVCACWSSATTYCGKNSGAAPVCVTSQNGNPASLQVNMSMDLGSTDQGWLDIVVRPDIPALDFSCSNWTLTWQVWE